MALAVDAVLVRERLYDTVDLRAAERVASVTVLIGRAAFETMLADFVEKRLLERVLLAFILVFIFHLCYGYTLSR